MWLDKAQTYSRDRIRPDEVPKEKKAVVKVKIAVR